MASAFARDLPAGYRLDASDADAWVLRREDGSPAAYFSAAGATKEGVEAAVREDALLAVPGPAGARNEHRGQS
jgi:hypothetical protein